MSRYPITVKEFAAFVNATGYRTDAEKEGYSTVFYDGKSEWKPLEKVTWRDDEVGKRRNDTDWNKPVIHISWNDAAAYCLWLGGKTGIPYRLPTEAEWEYAAGNGSKHTTYSWGNYLPGKGDIVENVRDGTTHPKYKSWSDPKFTGYYDGYFFASPVGCYNPNDLGLYDMTGNVWEWCNDQYDENYYKTSPTRNPLGARDQYIRVFRGGSWHSNPSRCRVTLRLSGTPTTRTPNLGFRVVAPI